MAEKVAFDVTGRYVLRILITGNSPGKDLQVDTGGCPLGMLSVWLEWGE